ncbi:cell division protein SepF [Cyanobium sp. NIES-981]|uniref:cell division protein SepF n=1 Tax=Cyanobium sp. NIES-981 TaxID=1851505 RepID=UPI000B352C27|nr:cell division protein SepF [Cyanobium sp. NIES-981]
MQTPFGDWLPEVVVFHPLHFEDAQEIVQAVRELKTVVVNAGSMDRAEAQRLIDFVAGGVSAIDGQAECLDAVTFVFAPELISLRREASPGSPGT